MGFLLRRSCNYFTLIDQFRYGGAISVDDDGSIDAHEELDLGCLQIYQIEEIFRLIHTNTAVVVYTNQFQMDKCQDPCSFKHKMSEL